MRISSKHESCLLCDLQDCKLSSAHSFVNPRRTIAPTMEFINCQGILIGAQAHHNDNSIDTCMNNLSSAPRLIEKNHFRHNHFSLTRYKFAQCCGFSAHPGAQSRWPIITSNNTITPGFNMTDYEGGLHWQGPGNNSEPHLVNFSDPSSPMHAPGKCPATGINSDTNFYKSTWSIPTKVFEFADFLPPPPPAPPHGKPLPPSADEVTDAVQACVDAAAKAGGGSIAYFPTGV